MQNFMSHQEECQKIFMGNLKKAEDIIKSKLNNYLIIRPGWVFGSTIKSKKKFLRS